MTAPRGKRTAKPTPATPALSPAEQETVDRFEAQAVDLQADPLERIAEALEALARPLPSTVELAADQPRDLGQAVIGAPHPEELGALRRVKATLAADTEQADDAVRARIVTAFRDASLADPNQHQGMAAELAGDLERLAGRVSGPDLEAVVRLADRAAR